MRLLSSFGRLVTKERSIFSSFTGSLCRYCSEE